MKLKLNSTRSHGYILHLVNIKPTLLHHCTANKIKLSFLDKETILFNLTFSFAVMTFVSTSVVFTYKFLCVRSFA